MEGGAFQKLLGALGALTDQQRQELLHVLQNEESEQRVIATIESLFVGDQQCIYCGAETPYKHGQAHGMRRYRCRSCKRTYNALSRTPLARLRHKDRWLAYLRCLANSKTVKKSAEKVGVHRNTAFRWRHRFLAWITQDQPQALQGIAEADETFLLESCKGDSRDLSRPPRKRGGKAPQPGISNHQVCILVARDRSGHTADWVVGRGRMTQKALNEHLAPRLSRDTLLFTDGLDAYEDFANNLGIAHWVIREENRDSTFHINHVNAYHSRLKRWLRRFNGVATRYLPNYLGWRRLVDTNPGLTPGHILQKSLGGFEAALQS